MEEIKQLLKRITIYKMDDITVSIHNKDINFMYTIADSIVKDEFKGKYEYVGGLQCNYEKDSEMYKLLEKELCNIAYKILVLK